MKPLTLYNLDYSPPVRSVDLVIHALGLPVEYKNISMFENEHLSSEFIKLNPLHTMPVIVEEDGFVLWESRAIMSYLVSKYGKDDSLYPKDLQKRAIVDQRLHYSNDVFCILKEIGKAVIYYNVKTVSTAQLAKVQECQANIEKLLEGNKFIAGDTLTVTDYSFITQVDVLEVYSPTKDQFPETDSWRERCRLTMKDFDKVNKIGADKLIANLKKNLSL